MKPAKKKLKPLWSDHQFLFHCLFGFLFLLASFVINYVAIQYAAHAVGNATTDILLQNLPVINTNIIFSEGALVFVLFIITLMGIEPKIIPYTLKSIALFITVRACFVVMTHIGPSPMRIMTDFGNYKFLTEGTDLFFSGHTGLPFLMALLFWDHKYMRAFFILCSVIAGAAVLFGHLHYSIDVFSAFFITYGISHIAQVLFPEDYVLFEARDLK